MPNRSPNWVTFPIRNVLNSHVNHSDYIKFHLITNWHKTGMHLARDCSKPIKSMNVSVVLNLANLLSGIFFYLPPSISELKMSFNKIWKSAAISVNSTKNFAILHLPSFILKQRIDESCNITELTLIVGGFWM